MQYPLLTTIQLGQLLLSARKAKKLTQTQLGVRVGLSQARISQIELNPETITAQQLLLITSVLDLEVSVSSRDSSTKSESQQPSDW